ncbi:dipeptidase [Streptacidiphilus pinicola]|uniref:Dipeptidase n=1 Tax=Streptacidiphilus pinicola TaxID=2219663 RepID=A0A2X0K783_9ACTN|nr:dipeptidase [Streptacidiphilus pinicola]RAG85125.1 dipeptidase [Streptacidiphilus pinicola]
MSLIPDHELREAVDALMPRARVDLERLVAIPSVSFPGFDPAHVDASAAATAELLREAGLPDVRIVRAGGRPAVIGRRPAPEGAPTVLLYAHHDVQPAGDPALWDSAPFTAVERDGRLFGRGAADDKAGVLAHVTALRALGDRLPVGVVVFVEGEEEYGSVTLPQLLAEHGTLLSADVIVIADSQNWDIGAPSVTTSLRGTVNLFVDVRTSERAVHSGMFGGPVPDALTALVRLLGTLHDEKGSVAVAGLKAVDGVGSPGSAGAAAGSRVDYPEERLRREAGLMAGVELIGTGAITERLWDKPAISVLGIDAPRTDAAPNALIPAARAKVGVRFAPSDSIASVHAAVRAHLLRHAPWGAQVTVELEHDGAPCLLDSGGPAHATARDALRDAWDGTEPVEIGVGGSIPFIAAFRAMFPHAEVIVTGVEDPESSAHGPNESLHLGEFARACFAEALLLSRLGGGPAAR